MKHVLFSSGLGHLLSKLMCIHTSVLSYALSWSLALGPMLQKTSFKISRNAPVVSA